jgi:hypothetical protein
MHGEVGRRAARNERDSVSLGAAGLLTLAVSGDDRQKARSLLAPLPRLPLVLCAMASRHRVSVLSEETDPDWRHARRHEHEEVVR